MFSISTQGGAFGSIFESSPSPMFISAMEDSRVLAVNDAFTRLLGYTADEACGLSVTGLFRNPEDRRLIRDRLVNTRTSSSLESVLNTSSGDTVPVVISAHQIDLQGRSCVLSILHDISDRVSAEANVRESKERYKDLVDGLNAVVWEIDLPGFDFSFVSGAVEKLLGYPQDEWYEPEFWINHIHADDRSWALEYCQAEAAKGTDYNFEYRMIANDGGEIWVRDIVQVVKDNSGIPRKLRGILIDITGVKQAETDLNQTRDSFMKAIDISPDGIYIVSFDTNKMHMLNATVTQSTGYTIEDFDDSDPGYLLWADIEERNRYKELLGRDGRCENFFAMRKRKDGTSFPSVMSSSVIEINGEKCAFNIVHNISDQVRANAELKLSEERFALAMQGADQGLWDWDLMTGEIYFSPRMTEMLGYRPDELDINVRTILSLIHPDDVKHVIARRKQFLRGDTDKYEAEFRARHKEGRYIDILSRGFGVTSETTGKISRMVGTHLDITGRKKTEKRIKNSEARFRALYDDTPAMFFTLGKTGQIKSVNRFGAEHLGMTVDSLIGQSIVDFTHQKDKNYLKNELKKCAAAGDSIHKFEFRMIRQYGDTFWVRATMRSIIHKGRSSLLVTCEDISETRILSEQLEYQAQHDALTGLINRNEFESRVRRILSVLTENSEHALCYLDLDQFKIINDTCGHLAGDELLRRISDLLNTVVRKRDTLARLGGDEFAVLLEHCPFYKAEEIAKNLLETIKTYRFEWQGKHFTLGASIGLVPINRNSGSLTDILSTADSACYAAKDAGRNRVHVYTIEDDTLSVRRSEMHWVAEITAALEEDRFQLAIQPIINLDLPAGQVEGKHYEVLIRMEDRDGNLILPGSFLPAAEKYNLSGKIDQWVVNHIFNWLQDHPDELESLDLCSINLSGLSMGNPQFMSFLLEKFDSCSVPAEKICFEITETAAIANLGHAIKFMNTMSDIGCLFSLDDFGTGLSSFSYLKNLPVDFLKIDGIFIRSIVDDPIDQAMVQSINEIGRVMGKKTIAEFVENDEIMQILIRIGVNYAQGYGVGRPVLLRDI